MMQFTSLPGFCFVLFFKILEIFTRVVSEIKAKPHDGKRFMDKARKVMYRTQK